MLTMFCISSGIWISYMDRNLCWVMGGVCKFDEAVELLREHMQPS
jgi:hypothetical protein